MILLSIFESIIKDTQETIDPEHVEILAEEGIPVMLRRGLSDIHFFFLIKSFVYLEVGGDVGSSLYLYSRGSGSTLPP